VSIGVPVRRAGRVKYVLGANLYARMFSGVLARQVTPPGGVLTLLDASRHIVARTRNEDRYIGQSPTPEFMERSRLAPEGSWRTVLLEGTRAYSAWSRSGVSGWTVGIGLPADPIDAPLRRSFYALVTAEVAVCGAGLMGALLLGRRLVATQAAAAEAARALAHGQAIPPFDSHITEAHELAVGLSEAAAILNRRLAERDEAQAEADRHRAALLDRETSARQTAEALSRAKDEFIATVSHELRTPLNAIYGWVAMLRTGTLDAARQAHALEVIDRNTRAQAQLIEDLLDMSRGIRGDLRIEMTPLDLSAVLEAAIESVRPAAEARRITLHVDAPHGVALASGDSGRLQQILWNLLSNAVKFTPPGGRVDAHVIVARDEAVVRIRDSGEGISADFLPHVFDRFRQENAEVTRTHSGLGLGLSLVRHLTELHGGTIAAASGGKGKGSTFTVRLPLLGAGGLTGAPAPAAAPPPLPADALRGRHILIVEDEADARELLAETLGQAGARVTMAVSAPEALAALDGSVPDAIVTDIGLPAVSGYELARSLREDPRAKTVPIIALTAYSAAEVRDATLAAGFTAYVHKPYDPRALVALVAGLIRIGS
jgi:signal transduction histidine kinase